MPPLGWCLPHGLSLGHAKHDNIIASQMAKCQMFMRELFEDIHNMQTYCWNCFAMRLKKYNVCQEAKNIPISLGQACAACTIKLMLPS